MAMNALELLNEIRKNGKAKCYHCNNGYLTARDDIPIEKQTHFVCNACGDMLILNYKFHKIEE